MASDEGHYPTQHWPDGADRAAYQSIADQSPVIARKDDLAKAMAEIDAGSKRFLSVAEKVHAFTPPIGFSREDGSGLIFIPGEAA